MERKVRSASFYLFITLGAVLVLGPVLWMVSASLMSRADVTSVPVNLLPPTWNWGNYLELFQDFNIGRYFVNSSVVAFFVVLLNLLFCSLVAYSLAKFRFPGRDVIFFSILATIMIPFVVIIIPLFSLARDFSLINSYIGLIAPFAMSGFGVFLMRQFILGIPDAYLEAARIDGASELWIFFRIILPLCKPALTTLAIITFTANWDEFLWPLIATTNAEYRTLPIGLAQFQAQYGNEWHLLMAGATVAALPLLALFVSLQGQFLNSGAGITGLKD